MTEVPQKTSSIKKDDSRETTAKLEALNKVQAMIEFNMDGTITAANDNFLNALGYTLDEIQGKHHSLFVEPDYQESMEYKDFWKRLNGGEYEAAEYKRLGKNGKEVWIQASYNPIHDLNGKPFKVVKYATDVTAQKLLNADFSGQIDAIGKAQAVIEFNMDGTIITANDNFLNTVGYSLDEIQGKHHSLFVESDYQESMEYKAFWERLNGGEYEAAEYKRLGKNGKEVWIQATYNPILDLNGEPFKVVKYATDVTAQKLLNADFSGQIDAIGKAQAVIEFNMDGTIITANDNFLNTVGYSLDEIQGKHHSLFVEPDYKGSLEYKDFWKRLNGGEYEAAEYKRLGKNGKEVWIQASYNPILDLNGEPFKVVKYATDITVQMDTLSQIDELIQSAVKGQMKSRIDTSGLEGFMASLVNGINNLMDTVVEPIDSAVYVTESLAQGDLRKTMDGDYGGEFKALADAVNSSMGNLGVMVRKIRDASNNVFSAAQQISEGNEDLTRRTESQAASVEETASALSELTATVKNNADNATQATSLVNSVMEQANNGGKVVSNTVIAMEAINKSSRDIADIIGVIDEIAFQTNLLALNAAVEAARAGEQGRGFAVVAAEVRNLAQRSASSAKEIKSLINESVDAVGEGRRLVSETGETFEKLVKSVTQVVQMTSEIDSASSEQAIGLSQIDQTVTSMDEITQKNAGLVEEITSCSKLLEGQAQELMNQVGSFKTN